MAKTELNLKGSLMLMLEKAAREKIQVELGNYLREKRELAQLTQGQVAAALKLESPQFISNIERGKCAVPMHVIRLLIKEYEIDKNQFLEFITDLQVESLRRSITSSKKIAK